MTPKRRKWKSEGPVRAEKSGRSSRPGKNVDLRPFPIWLGVVVALVCGVVHLQFGLGGGSTLRTSSFVHHSLTANAWLKGRLYVKGDEIQRQYYLKWFAENSRPKPDSVTTEEMGAEYMRLQEAWLTSNGFRGSRLNDRLEKLQRRPFHDWVYREVDGEDRYYAYWPPLPAAMMLPFVAFAGPGASDVLVANTIGVATAFFTYLMLSALFPWWPSLTASGCVLLTVLYCLGTCHLFQASLGQVWFLTQISGTLFLIIAVWLGFKSREHPRWIVAAGAALGIGCLGRLTVALAAPFFAVVLGTAVRKLDKPVRQFLIWGTGFALALSLVIAFQLGFNAARFGAWNEFGQGLLTEEKSGGNPIFTEDFKQHGRFSAHYLGTNIYHYFLGTDTRTHPTKGGRSFNPYGNSLFAVSPAMLYIFFCWQRERGSKRWATRADRLVPAGSVIVALCLVYELDTPYAGKFSFDSPSVGAVLGPATVMGVLLAAGCLLAVAQTIRHGDWLLVAVLAGLLPGTSALMLFHGTGFYTFGPRYLLDTLVFFLLLAGFGMGGRATIVSVALVGVSVAVNFWGTFRFNLEQF